MNRRLVPEEIFEAHARLLSEIENAFARALEGREPEAVHRLLLEIEELRREIATLWATGDPDVDAKPRGLAG